MVWKATERNNREKKTSLRLILKQMVKFKKLFTKRVKRSLFQEM